MNRDLEFTFVEVEDRISKAGQPYKMVKLADPVCFESIVVMLKDGIDYSRYKHGDKVSVDMQITQKGFEIRLRVDGLRGVGSAKVAAAV